MTKPRQQNPRSGRKGFRATWDILESIAKNYPDTSEEHEAVSQAAYAFLYLHSRKSLMQSYKSFLKNSSKPLTKTQRRTLKSFGVK